MTQMLEELQDIAKAGKSLLWWSPTLVNVKLSSGWILQCCQKLLLVPAVKAECESWSSYPETYTLHCAPLAAVEDMFDDNKTALAGGLHSVLMELAPFLSMSCPASQLSEPRLMCKHVLDTFLHLIRSRLPCLPDLWSVHGTCSPGHMCEI